MEFFHNHIDKQTDRQISGVKDIVVFKEKVKSVERDTLTALLTIGGCRISSSGVRKKEIN